MSRNRQRLINFHGSAGLPSPYDMAYGEIAVVHDPLDPKLAIRVSEMELRIFRSYEGKVIKTEDAFTALTSADTDYLVDAAFLKDYITTDEEVIASALNDLNDRLVAAENTIGDLDTSIEEGLESLDERMEAVEEQLENISELLPEMVVTEEESMKVRFISMMRCWSAGVRM